MPKELGVWTAEGCAPALIDHQNEMLEVIRSGMLANLVGLRGASAHGGH